MYNMYETLKKLCESKNITIFYQAYSLYRGIQRKPPALYAPGACIISSAYYLSACFL